MMTKNVWSNRIGTAMAVLAAVMVLGALNPAVVPAKDYPAKEVSLYVGAPPGGDAGHIGKGYCQGLEQNVGSTGFDCE